MPKRVRDNKGRFAKSAGAIGGTQPIFLRLDDATAIAIRGTAAKLDVTISALITEAVSAFVASLPAKVLVKGNQESKGIWKF